MLKYNVRRKAQLELDIREGGIAQPIANNMWYIHGRKHEDGGVTMGPNNKNGVEVEGGEVVEMVDSNHPSVGRQFAAGGQQQTMRVFSSVPFLRGVSPAELVMGGANPDTVFKAQEEFKDKNRINDDGTTYEMGGEGKAKSKRSRPVTGVLPYGYTIRNLYAVENPYKKGIKCNVAKMYDNRTLGAGVDVVSGHPELYKKAKSGRITKKQADETAVIHLRKDDNAIRNNYADVYGKAAADTLSYGPRFLVAQARYQQGNVRKAWPAIHKAMAKGNAKALKKAVLQVTPKDHGYRRKWIENFKVYKIGGMIYTINGNVKNGLMASRPKAQYGKQTIIRNNKKWEYDEKSGAFVPVKDVTKYKTIAGRTYKKEPNSKNYIEVTDSVEKAKLNKPKEVIVKQNNKSESNKESPAKENKYVSTTKFNTGESYIINPLTGEWIRNGVTETPEPSVKGTTKVSAQSTSTPRKGGTQLTTTSRGTAKVESPKPTTATNPMEARYASRVQKGQAQEVTTQPSVEYNEASDKNPDKNRYTRAAGFKAGEVPASPGNNQKEKDDDEKAKDARWIGQYKPVRTEDWIGLGSNLVGSVASYFMTKNAINKTPNPIKPVMAQAAKLKTRYNVEPQLSEIREAEQMNRAAIRRNTQSSNTSLAREQRLMNEARGARNTLYGQKENIETQLINQDRLNRQSVMRDNIRAYNEYLNRVTATKMAQNEMRASNINNLISGLTGSVNSILGNIESRRATNNTLRAIAAANPNVDARLIGGFDYYIDPITKRKYNKNQQYVGTING